MMIGAGATDDELPEQQQHQQSSIGRDHSSSPCETSTMAMDGDSETTADVPLEVEENVGDTSSLTKLKEETPPTSNGDVENDVDRDVQEKATCDVDLGAPIDSEEAENVEKHENYDDENPKGAHDVNRSVSACVGGEEQKSPAVTDEQTEVENGDTTTYAQSQEQNMLGLSDNEVPEPLPSASADLTMTNSACPKKDSTMIDSPSTAPELESQSDGNANTNTALISESDDPPISECNNNSFNKVEVEPFINSANNNNEHEHHETIDQCDNEEEDEGEEEEEEGDFVGVELTSPRKKKLVPEEQTTTTEQPQSATLENNNPNPTTGNDATTRQQQTADCASNSNNPDDDDDDNADLIDNTITIPPEDCTTNSNDNINSTNNNPTTTTMPTPQYQTPQTLPIPHPQPTTSRRKILRHPILTPLTKLPWDKIISAAGACDLLFNCKYSMKQVEDEVHEEYVSSRNVGGNGILLGNDEEGEYNDNGYEEGRNRVPRDAGNNGDGYVNLSLGNECGDFEQYGEEGCEVEDFAELGLGCCSMLDNESEEEDEVEVVAHGRLLEQQRQQQPMKSDDECKELQGVNNEQIGEESEEEEGDQMPSSSLPPQPSSSLMSNELKERISWKQSNPSLDMMLYRSMISD